MTGNFGKEEHQDHDEEDEDEEEDSSSNNTGQDKRRQGGVVNTTTPLTLFNPSRVHTNTQVPPMTRLGPSNNNNIPTTTITASHNDSSKRLLVQPLLYGYLHKRGRNGQWQRRWFEIDGKSLSYFKSKKHTSEADILATLDLSRVGEIQMDESDTQGCTFMIHVAKRNYYLHAESRQRAMDWVISLNRVREARLCIGGLTLIESTTTTTTTSAAATPTVAAGTVLAASGGGHVGKSQRGGHASSSSGGEEDVVIRKSHGEEGYTTTTTRVGLVSSGRERTRGYGKEDLNEDLKSFFVQPTTTVEPIMTAVSAGGGRTSPTSSPKLSYSVPLPPPRSSMTMTMMMYPPMSHALPPVPEETEFGRWEKRRNKLQNWTRRLSRWARRMTMIRCVIKDDVVPFAHSPPQFVHIPPHLSYMNYDPRNHYLHALNQFDVRCDDDDDE